MLRRLNGARKEKRYSVVLLDPLGKPLGRAWVPRRAIEGAIVAVLAVLLGSTALMAHGLLRLSHAREARLVEAENEALALQLGRFEQSLVTLRQQLNYAELTAAQLWATSGLGTDPGMLGIGPLQSNGREGDDDGAPSSSLVLDASPLGLELEISRIEELSYGLQQSLGDTLEYFQDARRLLSNTPSIRPTTTYETSPFGKRRDPMHGIWVMHKGLDLGGYVGLEIHAPADGVVIWTGWRGGYGQTVVVDHGYGLQTHYAHLSGYRVKPGQAVRRGDIIAEMGSSGRSTGPHLHYEVRRFGQPLNPRRFILD